MTTTEIRSFRGKDVNVTFFTNSGSIYDVEICLAIDNCKFTAIASSTNTENAYDFACRQLQRQLDMYANGKVTEIAQIELANAQCHLDNCKNKETVAKWFLDFTKDKA